MQRLDQLLSYQKAGLSLQQQTGVESWRSVCHPPIPQVAVDDSSCWSTWNCLVLIVDPPGFSPPLRRALFSELRCRRCGRGADCWADSTDRRTCCGLPSGSYLTRTEP